MNVKQESENAVLKFNIHKPKTMVSSSHYSQQMNGEKVETVIYFILGGSKITADGDCLCKIKMHFFLA